MSKALQQKIDELFETTKDLRNLEEIKVHCESFNKWINTHTTYSPATLGTKLSAYGFYKKFKSIPLEQDKNAVSIPKHNADGTIKGHELKHYATVLCGLDKEQWNERNQTTRVIDRLENSTEIDPDKYLETTEKLLTSDDPHELAVGLIAATGRRPHEIIARAKFTAIKDKPYHVMFEGQGKKRGETPVFEIATLYPAEQITKALGRLRKEPSTQALLKEVKAQFPKSVTRQNVEIDNRRGQSLRRVVRAYFGDEGDSTPVLAFRHGEKNDNNKALRAAYAVLATERDCKGGYGAKILHASRILGHFTPEKQDDRVLGKLGTSVGYSDYFVTKPVRFTEVEVEKEGNAKVYISDLDKIKELQKQWTLPSQKEVVRRLLKEVEHSQQGERQLVEAQGKIAHLQEALSSYEKQMNQLQSENQQLKEEREAVNQQPQVKETIEVTEAIEASSDNRIDKLEAQMAQMMAMMQQMVSGTASTKSQVEESPAPVAPRKQPAPKQEIDWESIPNEQLKSMKANGAVEEKIFRAYKAIAQYNDNAPSNDDRWYIGSTTLSQVSRCNRQNIGDWVKTHQTTVDDHNNKYGLGQYHNKRHKKVEITNKVRLWE
ncbi:MAG: protelomerase family protein [Brasilonema sp.]